MHTFPHGFYFGASTSSHQVEGGNENDWTDWERENANRLARESRKSRFSGFWPEKVKNSKPSPVERENYISGRAADHYHKFKEDFDLARELGHNAHRLSLEWSRIEPEEGVFAEHEIRHYREVFSELRARNIEPFVTLWHWTLPLWLSTKGGWISSSAPRYFARYAERMIRAFPDVKFWITINEPEVWASHAYLGGNWPPQKKNPALYLLALAHLVSGHRQAYGAIKKVNPETLVGIAKHNIYFESYSDSMWNNFLKSLANWWWNEWFLNRIKNTQDFIGLNHYFHSRISGWFGKNENKEVSDLGWELYPEGIRHVLSDLAKYEKPVYITENGLADSDDTKRAWFIEKTLENIALAIEEGSDVRGYLHWSLIDNFEWDKGFWPRFGLIEVDYQTLARSPRNSAISYRDLIRKYTKTKK
ncbi:MAG: glycoside hydrolase family 1 protein [Patescibacteria group bacterium]